MIEKYITFRYYMEIGGIILSLIIGIIYFIYIAWKYRK